MLRVLVDRSNCEHGVLSHIRVAVLKTCPGWGKKGLDELRFAEFAEKA